MSKLKDDISISSKIRTAAVFDLDGCLANTVHWNPVVRGRPFDFKIWMTENADAPVNAIGKKVFDSFCSPWLSDGPIPLFLTARNEDVQGVATTMKWLIRNGFWQAESELFMRPLDTIDPFIPDYIVKEDIFLKKIQPNYDVVFAIDDRQSVCEMWRKHNVPSMLVVNDLSFQR